MNREIKFRGTRIDNGEIVIGSSILKYGKSYICYKASVKKTIGRKDIWCETEVELESVGQFTGLHDKNGVEIYLDDLYIDEDGDVFKVMQMECGRYALERRNDGYVDEFIDWKCVEIIGNVYQNPELLK